MYIMAVRGRGEACLYRGWLPLGVDLFAFQW